MRQLQTINIASEPTLYNNEAASGVTAYTHSAAELTLPITLLFYLILNRLNEFLLVNGLRILLFLKIVSRSNEEPPPHDNCGTSFSILKTYIGPTFLNCKDIFYLFTNCC